MKLTDFGSSFEKGELVKVLCRDPRHYDTSWSVAVVLDYFPSNTYESASYVVLIDDKVGHCQAKNVYSV